eukprot:CAMPEP_0198498170 /NCGR_PEP_ID=MMETSP1462-20131121/6849_1 /TAXON_ID=1333877 /ORGANISM="Brandtodinium nutriculum, Strain RCC3387" /LENGTH=77 /DNA_ID=CAMNT_0044227073 /DNA_START=15 /DNA_END=245 /DNA_ORIENTATION=+
MWTRRRVPGQVQKSVVNDAPNACATLKGYKMLRPNDVGPSFAYWHNTCSSLWSPSPTSWKFLADASTSPAKSNTKLE